MRFEGEIELTSRYYVEIDAESEEEAEAAIRSAGVEQYIASEKLNGGIEEINFYLDPVEQENA